MSFSNAQARAARAHLKLDQRDISLGTGISMNQISRFEKGDANLSVANLNKLLSFFTSEGIEFTDHEGIRRKPTIRQWNLIGRDGLRQFFDDVYETTKRTGTEITIYNGVPGALIENLGHEWYEGHAKRMAKFGARVRTLIEYGDTNLIGRSFAQYKWLPKGQFVDKTIYSFGNKIGYMDFSDGVKILVIEEQGIAKSERYQFNSVWGHAAEDIPPNVC